MSLLRWVRLLAMFWAAAQCGAVQEGPAPDPGTSLSGTLDLLWTVVDRAVKSAVEPLVAELNTRLDSVKTELISRLDSVHAELGSVKSELNARIDSVQTAQSSARAELAAQTIDLASRLSGVQTGVDSVQTRLDSVQTAVDSANTELAAQTTELASRMEDIQSELDTLPSSIRTQLTSQNVDLTARLAGVQTRLENNTDGVKTRVDGVHTRLNSVQTAQSRASAVLATRTADLASRLDGVGTKLDSLQSALVSPMDRVQSEVLAAVSPVHDCSDLPAGTASGVHLLQAGLRQPVPAYCDMETDGGGWIVIQRRADVQPRQDFFLDWDAYKQGFGELQHEFWWGNENIWRTTALPGRWYTLRIDLEDFIGNKRYAVYQNFTVAAEEDGYRLTVANYSGDAGDSLTYHSDGRFSTMDNDQDTSKNNCAEQRKGGWWYGSCYHANLNGRYRLVGETSPSSSESVVWQTWRGWEYSLKSVEMKIRPTGKI